MTSYWYNRLESNLKRSRRGGHGVTKLIFQNPKSKIDGEGQDSRADTEEPRQRKISESRKRKAESRKAGKRKAGKWKRTLTESESNRQIAMAN